MGIVDNKRMHLAWDADIGIPVIQNNISRNNFNLVKICIHFNNNEEVVINRSNPNYDRLFKIRPLLDIFRENCLQTFPTPDQAIDEQIIPYKGKISFKQDVHYVKHLLQ